MIGVTIVLWTVWYGSKEWYDLIILDTKVFNKLEWFCSNQFYNENSNEFFNYLAS